MGVAIVQIFCKLVQASAVFHLSIYLTVCLLMFILGSISLLNFLPVATLLRQLDSQNPAKTTFAGEGGHLFEQGKLTNARTTLAPICRSASAGQI